jgi:hypothetical protein
MEARWKMTSASLPTALKTVSRSLMSPFDLFHARIGDVAMEGGIEQDDLGDLTGRRECHAWRIF